MSDRLTTWFPLALLSVLAALSLWLDQMVQPAPERSAIQRHDPDYVIENFAATRMGPDGVARDRLSANKMMHFPDDDSTVLEFPHFVRFEPTRASVSVTAKHANVSSNGDNVEFMDDVKVVRGAYREHSAMVLTTSYLHVIPDQDLARTDKDVMIVDANTKITAVGLEFNNRAQTLKLMSHVRGTYVKPR